MSISFYFSSYLQALKFLTSLTTYMLKLFAIFLATIIFFLQKRHYLYIILEERKLICFFFCESMTGLSSCYWRRKWRKDAAKYNHTNPESIFEKKKKKCPRRVCLTKLKKSPNHYGPGCQVPEIVEYFYVSH